MPYSVLTYVVYKKNPRHIIFQPDKFEKLCFNYPPCNDIPYLKFHIHNHKKLLTGLLNGFSSDYSYYLMICVSLHQQI